MEADNNSFDKERLQPVFDVAEGNSGYQQANAG